MTLAGWHMDGVAFQGQDMQAWAVEAVWGGGCIWWRYVSSRVKAASGSTGEHRECQFALSTSKAAGGSRLRAHTKCRIAACRGCDTRCSPCRGVWSLGSADCPMSMTCLDRSKGSSPSPQPPGLPESAWNVAGSSWRGAPHHLGATHSGPHTARGVDATLLGKQALDSIALQEMAVIPIVDMLGVEKLWDRRLQPPFATGTPSPLVLRFWPTFLQWHSHSGMHKCTWMPVVSCIPTAMKRRRLGRTIENRRSI